VPRPALSQWFSPLSAWDHSDSRYRCRGDRTMLFKLDAGS